MFAEMILSKGRPVAPFASLALYSSDRTASSPRTAYLASLTRGFILLIFKLRSAAVVDIVRREARSDLGEDWNDGGELSSYMRCQRMRDHSKVRYIKSAKNKKSCLRKGHSA